MYWKIDENQTWLPLKKKKEKEYQTVSLFEKKKKSHYKNNQGVSFSFFNKKRNVKSVIQSPEKLLFLPWGSPK